MSATRLQRARAYVAGSWVGRAVPSNRKELADTALQVTASFATQLTVLNSVEQYAPNTWESVNQYQHDFLVGTPLAGEMVNGFNQALHTLSTGVEWTWKQLGLNLALKAGTSYAVQGLYNLVNMSAGRELSEVTNEERAAVDTLGTRVLEPAVKALNDKAVSGLRYLGGMCKNHYSMWKEKKSNQDGFVPLADGPAKESDLEIPKSSALV